MYTLREDITGGDNGFEDKTYYLVDSEGYDVAEFFDNGLGEKVARLLNEEYNY